MYTLINETVHYKIFEDEVGYKGFECKHHNEKEKRISWCPEDVEQKYCVMCNEFYNGYMFEISMIINKLKERGCSHEEISREVRKVLMKRGKTYFPSILPDYESLFGKDRKKEEN